jgi:uncharacterized protein (TIGR03000 family)
MRCLDATMSRRRRKIVFACSLILWALSGFDPTEGHAQMRYSGGFVRNRTERDNDAQRTTVPRTKAPAAPKTPRDYFPDSDLGFLLPYIGAGIANPPPSAATGPRYSVSSYYIPWNQPGFKDYDEPLRIPQDATLSAAKRYALESRLLSPATAAALSDTAMLIAHLPESALFWVEGKLTRSTGRTRYFRSPPLEPGRKYKYTVRAAWIEDGRWVSQTRTIPVGAGLVQAIYLESALAK